MSPTHRSPELPPEDRYRLFFEHAPVPIWELDFGDASRRLHGLAATPGLPLAARLAAEPGLVVELLDSVRVLGMNHETALHFRVDSSAEVTPRLSAYFDARSIPAMAGVLARVAAGESRLDVEVPCCNARGEGRVILLSVRVLPSPPAPAHRALTAFLDITARDQAARALENRDQLLGAVARITRLFLTHADLATTMTAALQSLGMAATADRTYIFRNRRDPASGRMLSCQCWEWAREGISAEIQNPDMQDLPYDILEPDMYPTLAEGRPFWRLTHETGATMRRLLEAQGIRSILLVPIQVHGAFWGYIGFDDTTRTRVWQEPEIAILQAAASAVGAAVERQHLEDRLQQARKMEAVGQLAGGIAHDFNNILTSILINLGLVQAQPSLEAAPRAALDEIEGEAHRAARLVRQLLLFGRQSQVVHQRFNLNGLIEDALGRLRRLLGRPVVLRFHPVNRSAPVLGDPELLDQVLVNLATNARDAMPRGGSLTLSTETLNLLAATPPTHPEMRPGSFVCLTVADTGEGMTPEVRRRAFEPFFTTKDVGKGTGLGLAVAYSIIQQHLGWMELESNPGQGCRIRIFLPLAESPTPAAPSPSAAPAPPPAASPRPAHETILLVDDEPSVRRTIGIFLRRQGYRVLEASDGTEAGRLWDSANGAIDLLFTDMVMPEGLSGLELAGKLRIRRPSLKVIIASGYSADLIREEYAEPPDVTFLTKPCSPAVLLGTVRSVLDGVPVPKS